VIEPWRRLGVYLLLFGMLGVGAELLLLEHFEEPWQWTPIVLLSLGLVSSAVVAWRPTRKALRTLQLLMCTYLLAAVLGIFFHVKSNVEFELELHPSMTGLELVLETLKGAMPALAPGAMAQLGLLGLLICYRHPTGQGQTEAPEVTPQSEN
jgi:hypothetical protein